MKLQTTSVVGVFSDIEMTREPATQNQNLASEWHNGNDCLPPMGNACCPVFDGCETENQSVRDDLIEQSESCDCSGGYYHKTCNLHSSIVVGKGPKVVISDDRITPEDSAHLKKRWVQWQKKSKFVKAIRLMRRAALKTGEAFAIFTTSNQQLDPVKLKVKLITIKRVKTPWDKSTDKSIVNGIKYDENSEPETFYYESGSSFPPKFETVESSKALYWFSEILEEQCRGVPELYATLKWFPKVDAFMNAVLDANILFAKMPIALKVGDAWISDEDCTDGVGCPQPSDKPIPLPKNGTMVPTLPKGTDFAKIQGEATGTNAKEFLKNMVTMCVSPLCMPALLIMGDAGDASFSGANIDWEPYLGRISQDREELEPLCSQTFNEWLLEGSKIPGYFGQSVVQAVLEDVSLGSIDIYHSWRWGAVKCHIDPNKEASARSKDLESGAMTIVEVYDSRYEDIEEAIEHSANFFGVTVEEYKIMLWEKLKSNSNQGAFGNGQQANQG